LLALSSRVQHILRRNLLKHMSAFASYLLDSAKLTLKEPSKKILFADLSAYFACFAGFGEVLHFS